MEQINQQKHPFDLEKRTLIFAKSIRDFCKLVPKSISNKEYIEQIIRSSGSIGANYIEANESLSKKDFVMRIKISRKETKETRYWLELIETEHVQEDDISKLQTEATELLKIFSSIIEKSL
jgi:four helix bundle protein